MHRATCSVHLDRGTEHMPGLDSALQHGLVLNHPLDVLYVHKTMPLTRLTQLFKLVILVSVISLYTCVVLFESDLVWNGRTEKTG